MNLPLGPDRAKLAMNLRHISGVRLLPSPDHFCGTSELEGPICKEVSAREPRPATGRNLNEL